MVRQNIVGEGRNDSEAHWYNKQLVYSVFLTLRYATSSIVHIACFILFTFPVLEVVNKDVYPLNMLS